MKENSLFSIFYHCKVINHSSDGDTDFFDIVAGVFEGDPLAPYLFINYLDCILRTLIDMKENDLTLKKKKAKTRLFSAETTTGTKYVDDFALLANAPTHTKSLLHNLVQTAGSINLYVNLDKTELMCFNQDGAVSTLNGKPLKLVDHFIYLSSNISSTET